MDRTLEKVLAMLGSDDEEVQCAAAKVIGELQLTAADVIRALGDATQGPKSAVRCAALEALGKTGRSDALRYVLPHLASPQLAERNRAVSATVALGPDVLPSVVKEFKEEQPALRSMVLTILQRFPLAQSINFILEVLPKADQPGIDSICEDFSRKVPNASDAERMDIATSVRKFAARTTVRRAEGTLVAALRMLGALRDEGASALYLKLLEGDTSSIRVMRHALLGMGKVEIPAKEQAKLWKIVSEILKEDSNPALVQAAVEIAARLETPTSAVKEMLSFLRHRDGAVRLFAVRKLGEAATVEAGEALAECLEDPDWRLRREVMSSLQACPNAGEELLKRFESLEDAELARQASQAILEIKPKLTKAQFKSYLRKAIKMKEEAGSHADPLLAVLSSLDRDSFTAELTDLGKDLIKKGEYAPAEATLRLLVGPGSSNTEAKFLLALSRFKVSNKGLLRAERESNRSLSLFGEMVEVDGLDLGKMLIKEEALLDRSEIYYLGFHFVEQMGKLRQFGAALLKHLAGKFPRSQEGRDAKNKLSTSGID